MTKPKGAAAKSKKQASGHGFAARSFGGKFNKWASSVQARGGTGYQSETLMDPYVQEPWVYACVNKWAEAFASVDRLRLFRQDKNGKETEILAHPILDLLHDVNSQESFADHQDQIGRNLSLVGEHLILLANQDGDPISTDTDPGAAIPMPVALWPKMGGDTQIRPVCNHSTNRLEGWELLGARTLKVWPASSAVMVKLRRPGSRFRGMGPMGAAFGLAAQLYAAQRYQDGLLRSGGDPGGVIEAPEVLGDVEFERLKDEVEENWNNPDRAGEVRLLEGGAKYIPNTMKPRDMGFERLMGSDRKAISVTFGVPDAILGMGTSNYATFLGELRVLWTLTILPKLRLVENAYNENLLSRIHGAEGLYVKYDLSQIEALQADFADQIETAAKLQKLGIPLQQALSVAGITLEKSVPGWDVPLIATGMQRLSDLSDSEQTDGNVDGQRTADPSQTLNGAQIKSLVDIITSVRSGVLPRESALEIIVASFPFSQERAEKILGAIKEGEAPPPPPQLPPGMSGGAPDPAGAADGEQEPGDDGADAQKSIRWGAIRRSLDTREGREEAWRAVHAPLERLEDKGTRQLRRVFSRMRSETQDRIKTFAEKGFLGERAATPIYPGPLPEVPKEVAADLARAWLQSKQQVLELRTSCGCQVQMPHHGAGFTKAAQQAKLDLEQAERVAQVAVLRTITEAEIDRLVAALDQEFLDELALVLENVTGASVSVADKAVLAELAEGGFVRVGDPQLIVNLRTKAILVSEGSASVTAKQVRSAIIHALGSSLQDITSLQDALVANFDGVRSEVNRAYGMSAGRARTIARTEIGQVSSEVRDVRMTEAEGEGIVDGRVWSTAVPSSDAPPYEDGGFVRSEHWQMDGKRRTPGQPWIMPDGTQMRRPRDYGAPAHQVINCRCEEIATFPPDLEDIWNGDAEPASIPTPY